MIVTDKGEVPIERLRPEDQILTLDNGFQPLAMIASRRLNAQELDARPELKPIEFKPGALWSERRRIVSSLHTMLVRGGCGETLVGARPLSRLKGGAVWIMQGCKGVTYLHLIFDAHQVTLANSRPAESFFPGPLALAAPDAQARKEFEPLFPRPSEYVSRHGPAAFYAPTRQSFCTKDLPPLLSALSQSITGPHSGLV